MARPRALSAIIVYKTGKAGIQLGLALLLLVSWPLGLPSWLHGMGLMLHQHATLGWAGYLSELLLKSATPRALELSIAALFADGALTALEAWALASGRWWGPWLVVVALGALLPLELYEFVRTPRWSRLAILLLNAAIAAYLGRKAWGERRERA